jgi:hypothetical protein
VKTARSSGLLAGLGWVALLFGALLVLARGRRLDALALVHLGASALLLASAAVWRIRDRWRERTVASARGKSWSLALLALPLLSSWALLLAFHRELPHFDLSSAGLNTLSDQTLGVLATLDEPVELTLIQTPKERTANDHALALLERYRSACPGRIRLVEIDAAVYPQLLVERGVRPNQKLLVRVGTPEVRELRLSSVSEALVTGALIQLFGGEGRIAYLIRGLGVPMLEDDGPRGISSLQRELRLEGIELRPLPATQVAQVPRDASVVLWAGCQSEVAEAMVAEVLAFVRDGGGLFVAADPLHDAEARKLTVPFGIDFERGVVLDREAQVFSPGALGLQVLASTFAPHAITRPLQGRGAVILGGVAPLVLGKTPGAAALLLGGPMAGVESRVRELLNGTLSPAELVPETRGSPPVLAAVHELPEREGAPVERGRLAVFGDSDWLRNSAWLFYRNRDLALNTIHWLAGSQEAVLGRRASSSRTAVLAPTVAEFHGLMGVSAVGLELLLLVGLGVRSWRQR